MNEEQNDFQGDDQWHYDAQKRDEDKASGEEMVEFITPNGEDDYNVEYETK